MSYVSYQRGTRSFNKIKHHVIFRFQKLSQLLLKHVSHSITSPIPPQKHYVQIAHPYHKPLKFNLAQCLEYHVRYTVNTKKSAKM